MKIDSYDIDSYGCWVWNKSLNTGGYGHCWYGGRLRTAHRVSYELHNGPIPHGMCVLHHCDKPACINPEHLFIGTQADNVRDMDAKKRRVAHRGVDHGRAKMTRDDLTKIRKERDNGASYRALGRMFNIHHRTAMRIIKGESYT